MDIRHIINIVEDNSKVKQKGLKQVEHPEMEVMTLDQFIKDSGDEDVEEAKLPNVQSRKPDDKEMSDYASRIVSKEKDKKEKYKRPYIHRQNLIPIVDKDGKEYDLDRLRKKIKERPAKILKQNEKMQHSDGTSSIYFNVGLPALLGLAVDEEKNEFVIINTCPGAGKCQIYCYAMKGGYVQWKDVSMSQSKLLNYLYNDPEGFMRQLHEEILAETSKYDKKDTKVVVRWHDAGDFFSPDYLNYAINLAKSHPDVDFYAYTKIADVAKKKLPDNFKMNFSSGAKPSQEKQIDLKTTKSSFVVPREIFNDLIAKDGNKLIKDKQGRVQFKSKQDLETFKERLAAKYSVDPKTILTYDQMMSTPKSDEKHRYNVIVMPGDGDDSANRNDVLTSFLVFH